MEQLSFAELFDCSPPIGFLTDAQLRAAGWFVGETEDLDAWLAERAKGRKGKR